MKLADLQNNQIVTYRLGRAGRNNVEWNNWITGPIYVNRRGASYKNRPVGELLTLCPIGQVSAEFGEKIGVVTVFVLKIIIWKLRDWNKNS